MAEHARVVSIAPEQTRTLPEYSWEELREPGTYVEKETGDLYRIPKEVLIGGVQPMICKANQRISKLVQLSRNPFMTAFVARITCVEHNVKSSF
jgi:hypothetical protein